MPRKTFTIDQIVRIIAESQLPGNTNASVADGIAEQTLDDCLVGYEYRDVREARKKIEEWVRYYNEERPHSSLGYKRNTMRNGRKEMEYNKTLTYNFSKNGGISSFFFVSSLPSF